MMRTWWFVLLLGCGGSDGAVGPEGPIGPVGEKGERGDKGDPGIDTSAARIYGDGSAGALVVSANGQLLNGVATAGNLQFTDVTIDAGVTLTVPSGVIIRCTGTFTNNGTIEIATAASGGIVLANSLAHELGAEVAIAPAHPGVALMIAASGGVGDSTARRVGGFPGESIGVRARLLLHPGLVGGGGGAATLPNTRGGAGGGTMTVLAAGAILNNGTITANGADAPAGASGGGAGGGGGGVLIMASRDSVTNAGEIQTRGGAGGSGNSLIAAGGGGGGGIVHFIAPTSVEGDVDRRGGANGTSVPITAAIRAAGSGGGACGGSGGQGASVAADGTITEASAGGLGVSSATQTDPTSLF